MGFFGMSQEGKDARNQINQQSGWNFGQARDSSQQGAGAGNQADFLTNAQIEYLQNRVNAGLATPEEMRTLGERADPYTKQRMSDAYGRIGGIQGERRGTITDSATRNLAREDSTHGQVMDGTNETYGGLNAANNESTSSNMKDIDSLNPATAMRQATTARSFAPALTNTMDRLRRTGVDPNSLQAASVITDIEARRAQAMDDNVASGTADYVRAKTGERTAQLGRQIGLGQDQEAINRGENIRWTGAQKAEDTAYADKIGALNKDREGTNYQRMQDENAVDDKQFGFGNTLSTADTTYRDTAAGALGQIGQQRRNDQFNFGQQAQGWQQQGTQGAQATYQNEAQNAGWGAKALIGAGGAALGAYLGKPN
jgi:hypothetical protein